MTLAISRSPSGFTEAFDQLTANRIPSRILSGDYTVWAPHPEEISNRLGWLQLPRTMRSWIPEIGSFVESLLDDRFEHVVLLGMGGSSLAPDMLSRIMPPRPGALSLEVLDSTHPASVARVTRTTQDVKTLFLVATKSGTTSETLSLFRHFYRVLASRGVPHPGRRFAAITDPDTPLAEQAAALAFRKVFLNPPDVGGRYSALSLFGLVPAALLGLDLNSWLHDARAMADVCSHDGSTEKNPAAELAAYLGAAVRSGRDKATFLLSRTITPFGDWVEQLIAESSGKNGAGILPVLEPIETIAPRYGQDRAFVLMSHGVDRTLDETTRSLQDAGHPVARIELSDVTDLSGQIYLWEMATAMACHLLGVHPFNQPNVESAKRLAREAVDAARNEGAVRSLANERFSARAVANDLEGTLPGDYVALHAYLPISNGSTRALHELQAAIRDRFGIAVTVGYGPRFLHSTGQLHKGDAGRGRFIQLVSPDMPSVPIPDGTDSDLSTLSFADLITSQTNGDRRALEAAGRRVATYELPDPCERSIQAVVRELGDMGS